MEYHKCVFMYLINLPHLVHGKVSLACPAKLSIYAPFQEKKFSMVSFTVSNILNYIPTDICLRIKVINQ